MADGSLEEDDFVKITDYYGLAVPAILGEGFCALRGIPMAAQERLASTCQGAMTGIADDFFDKNRMSAEMLKGFIDSPTLVNNGTAGEYLLSQFYKSALESVNDPSLMKEHIYKVFDAQRSSKQQALPGMSYEEIKDITFRKGRESLLFYRTAFSHPYENGEKEMLSLIGELAQLGNDLFDVYKDQQQGIHTLVTETPNVEDLRLLFSSQWNAIKEAAYKTKYPTKNVNQFIDILSISIFSRCFVCLKQLEAVQEKYGGAFNPTVPSRKELICDMDTPLNKLRSLWFHFSITA